jgi:hypothetical protein
METHWKPAMRGAIDDYRISSLAASNITGDSATNEPLQVPLYVAILILFGILVVLSYTYCFFCVPSTNKRKIYAMMKEAKLENEGHG